MNPCVLPALREAKPQLHHAPSVSQARFTASRVHDSSKFLAVMSPQTVGILSLAVMNCKHFFTKTLQFFGVPTPCLV
jgi:hypothetical protein